MRLTRFTGHLRPSLPVPATTLEVMSMELADLSRRRARLTHRTGLLALAVSLTFATGLMGCAAGEFRMNDPLDRKYTLEIAQHRYTVLVRWADFDKAKRFVAKEERDDYMARMEVLEDARFTDYESESVELDEDLDEAVVEVTYTLYLASSPFEIEVTETQEWSRDGITNDWHVHSVFNGLPEFASN